MRFSLLRRSLSFLWSFFAWRWSPVVFNSLRATILVSFLNSSSSRDWSSCWVNDDVLSGQKSVHFLLANFDYSTFFLSPCLTSVNSSLNPQLAKVYALSTLVSVSSPPLQTDNTASTLHISMGTCLETAPALQRAPSCRNSTVACIQDLPITGGLVSV